MGVCRRYLGEGGALLCVFGLCSTCLAFFFGEVVVDGEVQPVVGTTFCQPC